MLYRKIHSMSSADSEFDFSESFWRYELSLARLHGLPRAEPMEPPSMIPNPAAFGSTTALPAVSPNEILLELHPVDTVPSSASTARTTTKVSDMPNVGPAVSSTIDSNAVSLGELPSLLTATAELPLDPLVRLQTMFQGVHSRAVSPISFERNITHVTADIQGSVTRNTDLHMNGPSGSHAELAGSGQDGYTGLLDELGFPLPIWEDPSPFIWNFWDEQGARLG